MVLFSEFDCEIFAIKETVPEFANREYTILRDLNQKTAPCVEPVAVIEGRLDKDGNEITPSLINYFPLLLKHFDHEVFEVTEIITKRDK